MEGLMYRKLARVIGSVAAAALLAMSLSACGGGDAPEPKMEEPKKEEPKKEEPKKESDAGGAKEVTYKCAMGDKCSKPAKTAAAGAAAPQC